LRKNAEKITIKADDSIENESSAVLDEAGPSKIFGYGFWI